MLWRHGRTAWNADGRFQGQLDPELDALGRRQATGAAATLAALPPTAILSSDLQRASATAATLAAAAGLPVCHEPRLREIDLGSWQGLTRDEVAARFPAEYDAWIGGGDMPRGHGETYAEVGERAVAAVRQALADVPAGGALVAVTHGGTARAVLGVLLELPPEVWWRLAPLGNACWSVLVEGERGWRLAEHNAGTLPTPEEAGGDDAR